MSLASAVCSITVTQRRRYFWAAWWTGAPTEQPFRSPDASNGGARSEGEALAQAQRVAGRHLTLIEPYWARAYTRVLRGEAPPPRKRATPRQTRERPQGALAVLGLAKGASASEIRTAYRKRALETHPDQGGSAEAFRAVQSAYERLKHTPRKR